MADGLIKKNKRLYDLLNDKFLNKSEIAKKLYEKLDRVPIDKRKATVKLNQKEKERQEISSEEIYGLLTVIKDLANRLTVEVEMVELELKRKTEMEELFGIVSGKQKLTKESIEQFKKLTEEMENELKNKKNSA